MLEYRHFDDLFGYRIHRSNAPRSAVVCPLCGNSFIQIDDGAVYPYDADVAESYGDPYMGGLADIEFVCEAQHRFRLTLWERGGHVTGSWDILTSESGSLSDLPTEKQFALVERISQRLGIDNPWSDSGCLFAERIGPDGLPLFMTSSKGGQRITKEDVGEWIHSHIDEYRDHGRKTSGSDSFVVSRLNFLDRSELFVISIPPSAIDSYPDVDPQGDWDVWVGPGVLNGDSKAIQSWGEEPALSWDERLPESIIDGLQDRLPDAGQIRLESKVLLGHWEKLPLKEKRPRKDELTHSYRKAMALAEACAVKELEEGRAIFNRLPDFIDGKPLSLLIRQ
mgnify:CR=1 FL=1